MLNLKEMKVYGKFIINFTDVMKERKVLLPFRLEFLRSRNAGEKYL